MQTRDGALAIQADLEDKKFRDYQERLRMANDEKIAQNRLEADLADNPGPALPLKSTGEGGTFTATDTANIAKTTNATADQLAAMANQWKIVQGREPTEAEIKQYDLDSQQWIGLGIDPAKATDPANYARFIRGNFADRMGKAKGGGGLRAFARETIRREINALLGEGAAELMWPGHF
jgi:hypothetical protein